MENEPLLQLDLPGEAIAKMGALLGQGVRLTTRTGISLWDFLCGRVGLAPDYVQDKLQTVFVNGRAVDRFDTVYIRDGDTIALSSAMPGLVGATLRRGGHLSGMRAEISHTEDQCPPDQQKGDGSVHLKLFNVVAREAGGRVLGDKVRLPAQTLLDSLNLLKTAGQLPGPEGIRFNGRACTLADIEKAILPEPWLVLQINWH